MTDKYNVLKAMQTDGEPNMNLSIGAVAALALENSERLDEEERITKESHDVIGPAVDALDSRVHTLENNVVAPDGGSLSSHVEALVARVEALTDRINKIEATTPPTP